MMTNILVGWSYNLTIVNDFFNFVEDSCIIFKKDDKTTLKEVWEMYKTYCEEAKCIQLPKRIFKEELKNYFKDYQDRFTTGEGNRVRSYYEGFRIEKFEGKAEKKEGKTERGGRSEPNTARAGR